MTALTRILTGSDLSEWADLALQRAALLAGQHGARRSVLHVVDPEELPAAGELERLGETPHRFRERQIAETQAALDARAAQYGSAIRPDVPTGQELRGDH